MRFFFERFIGILIEHYAGAFPLWLSPTQIAICPITDNNLEYSKKVEEKSQIYQRNNPDDCLFKRYSESKHH